MSNIDNLAAQASVIRQESEQGANTAERVGSLLEGIVSELGTTQNSLTTIYNEFINSGGSSSKITTSWIPAAATGRTTLGTLIINGTSQIIDAAVGSGSGSDAPGGGGSEGGVTPSDVQDQIDTLNNAIATAEEQAEKEKSRLDALLKKLDSQITDEVLRMDDQAAWIQQNFDADKVFGYSGWDDAMQGYMQRVGLWKTDENTTKTFWSDIQHTYNGIKTTVNAVSDAGGLSEYLSSNISQWIADGSVTIDLGTMYAAKEAESIIEWLYSGLKSHTSPDRTFNEIVSAGKNGLNSAIADIHTYVEKLKNGDYVAGTDISTEVNEAIASIWQKVQSGEVTTGALAELNGNIATLVEHVTGDSSTATIATKVDTWKAGLVTTSNLDSALISLIATEGETYPNAIAAITAKVQEGLSSIKFEADTIESVSQQYTIHMDKLLLGNSNFYMHTLKDNQDNNIGFEMVCAENVLQNYTEDPNGDYNKITMYYDYTAMTKLSCDHIIMSNGDQRTEQHPEYGYSDVNVECGTTFNWYDNVNANSSTGKYEFKNAAGTEGAYSGSIKFSSRGLEINMPVGKHIYLNGNIVHQTA